jgi:hypothetical protein
MIRSTMKPTPLFLGAPVRPVSWSLRRRLVTRYTTQYQQRQIIGYQLIQQTVNVSVLVPVQKVNRGTDGAGMVCTDASSASSLMSQCGLSE